MDNKISIVLASSSPYRKELLEKLDISFSTFSPDIDESQLKNESPKQLVERLSIKKAKAVADKFENTLIIASDQVSTLDNNIIGKPGNKENAFIQLSQSSGKKVVFYTGLTLLNSLTDNIQTVVEKFTVYFKELSESEINNYLDKEKPFNCAGSFKSEGLGISLFSKLEGDDPNSLIGLPLIKLVEMLKNEGVNVI